MSIVFPTDSPLLDDLFSANGLRYGAMLRTAPQGEADIALLSEQQSMTMFDIPGSELALWVVDTLSLINTLYEIPSNTETMTWPAMDLAILRSPSQTICLFGSQAQAVNALYTRIGKMEFPANVATRLLLELGYDQEHTTKYIADAQRAKAAETAAKIALGNSYR